MSGTGRGGGRGGGRGRGECSGGCSGGCSGRSDDVELASPSSSPSSPPPSSSPPSLPPPPPPSMLSIAFQSINVVGISTYLSLLSTYVSLIVSKGARGDDTDGAGHGDGHGRDHRHKRVQRPAILPTIETADIRNIDWAYLYAHHGIRGVMFDKDHTLTLPYAKSLHPYAEEALVEAKRVFGARNVVLYSNSAGLKQYDPEGLEAAALAGRLGVEVLRHAFKKPFVSGVVRDEVEGWFGVGVEQLVMVGDRYMTDVVFGNQLGMMTIRVKPYVEVRGGNGKNRDPMSVRVSRRLEEWLVRRFRGVLGE